MGGQIPAKAEIALLLYPRVGVLSREMLVFFNIF